MQLDFAEAEPVVRVELPRFFEPMTQQIEYHETSTPLQNAISCADGALGVNSVVQRLTEDCQIDAVSRDRRVFNIAKAVFEILKAMLLRQLGAELDHLRRIIDGNNLARLFRQQLREGPPACPEIGNGQRREQSNERVRKRLP